MPESALAPPASIGRLKEGLDHSAQAGCGKTCDCFSPAAESEASLDGLKALKKPPHNDGNGSGTPANVLLRTHGKNYSVVDRSPR